MKRKIDTEVEKLPEVVMFDWDGTLVDSFGFIKAAHNHVRTQFGLKSWSNEEYKEVMKLSTREAFGSIYGEDADKAQEMLTEYVDANFRDSLCLMDGASDILELLSQLGIKIGVVSNKRHERLVADIKELGWDRYVDAVVGAGRAEYDKPAPDPLLLCLEEMGRFGKDHSTVWYVGDSSTDLEASRAAKIPSVFVLHGVGDESLADEYRPFLVFKDLNALIVAIKHHKG